MQYVDPSSKTTVSPIMWTALLFSFLISFYKALVVAHTVGGVVGYAVGSLILPLLIAYAIAGREEVRGKGYAFAAWLTALSILFIRP